MLLEATPHEVIIMSTNFSSKVLTNSHATILKEIEKNPFNILDLMTTHVESFKSTTSSFSTPSLQLNKVEIEVVRANKIEVLSQNIFRFEAIKLEKSATSTSLSVSMQVSNNKYFTSNNNFKSLRSIMRSFQSLVTLLRKNPHV
ncbi:unnamed protein product [Sphenostylis stenocarpa]|uniref:Uncharacterized protein n=1 Tax=Sphenostylis stenocarpa TaxID=92480 RepID=A0AA86STS3_9FABA|nr:unnamed protein product [Sphenostylis stenocarpa]